MSVAYSLVLIKPLRISRQHLNDGHSSIFVLFLYIDDLWMQTSFDDIIHTHLEELWSRTARSL